MRYCKHVKSNKKKKEPTLSSVNEKLVTGGCLLLITFEAVDSLMFSKTHFCISKCSRDSRKSLPHPGIVCTESSHRINYGGFQLSSIN